MTLIVSIAAVGSCGLLIAGILFGRNWEVLQRAMPAGRRGPRVSPLEYFGRRVRPRRARTRVEARLVAAGVARSVDWVMGLKVVLALAGCALGIVLSASGPILIVVSLAVVCAAFNLPDFFLARRASMRKSASLRVVPDVLDVVAIGVTAGLTPRIALDRAGSVARGPLVDELERARREVALGTSWHRALQGVGERTGSADVRRLATTLDRSARLGTPVADQLRSLAHEVRDEHRAREEERARRAPVVMLFPLVFLILPGFVLAAVLPALLAAARGIQ
ncbi:MAG: type II secretion system F family protein [Actinomycetota bacterium]